uniref:Uncharacterized protein n=1 Tax=Spumella elongata TaxID=89044 RepID=A0A7S3HG29_9STRA|mmetsp:Transcript_50443/g.88079  ORF Transcript_50443/g.88079 Transcript_50443/m.88079 type:complete len:157 (+) Transcript_50443:2-472(+)
MPGVQRCLDELEIPVVLAREDLSPHCRREAYAETRHPATFMKRRAMERVISNFYGRPRHGQRRRSWKNIVSVGDSPAERLALQDLVLRRVQRDRKGNWKDCRCKTLKLMEEPNLSELTAEVIRVAQWLPGLVHHDGDVDLEVDGEDIADLMASIRV